MLHYFQSSTRPGCNKGNEVDESSKKARKPELVNSEDNENSRGAVGQVLAYSIPDPLVVISKISCMISTTSKDKILINNLL